VRSELIISPGDLSIKLLASAVVEHPSALLEALFVISYLWFQKTSSLVERTRRLHGTV